VAFESSARPSEAREPTQNLTNPARPSEAREPTQNLTNPARPTEARETTQTQTTTPPVQVHVATLALRGLAPWSHASTLAPLARAVLFGLTGFAAAFVAALGVLLRAARGRFGAIVLGASGPLAALALLRALERSGAHAPWFLAMPLVAAALAAVAALVLSRLPARKRAASTTFEG
jgi:hypothetical protein